MCLSQHYSSCSVPNSCFILLHFSHSSPTFLLLLSLLLLPLLLYERIPSPFLLVVHSVTIILPQYPHILQGNHIFRTIRKFTFFHCFSIITFMYILFDCIIIFPLYLFCLPIFYVITATNQKVVLSIPAGAIGIFH